MERSNSCINHIVELVVMENGWKGREWRVLDLSFMPKLRLLEVGDKCFEYVDDMRLIGLNRLESVVIGERCFTKHKNDWSYDANRAFALKNCERLRELKMGRYSFSDYDVCEIENVPSLEVIEMGELSDVSSNFEYGSLQLKNLPRLKSLQFGCYSFYQCSRAVFENLPVLTSIRFGENAFCFNDDEKSSELIMRNLPKLASLTTNAQNGDTFRNPRHITLENMPSLTIHLPRAFFYRDFIRIK
ncbi:hypothetical protein WA556_002346, partial [Blastocystis sp. ATCC 50177/Nand II]